MEIEGAAGRGGERRATAAEVGGEEEEEEEEKGEADGCRCLGGAGASPCLSFTWTIRDEADVERA